MGVAREDGEAVARRHEEALRHDHVAVAVAIGGRAEIGRIGAVHQLHEVMGVDRIRIGMVAAEIGLRLAVHHRSRRGAEAAYERLLTLPLHAGMTTADVDDVVRALDKVAEAYLVRS